MIKDSLLINNKDISDLTVKQNKEILIDNIINPYEKKTDIKLDWSGNNDKPKAIADRVYMYNVSTGALATSI